MSKPSIQPLITWRGKVDKAWVDYNQHLNDAYYLVVFSYATEGLMAEIGMDAAGRAATGQTIYTLEVHLNYILEVHEGVAIEVRTQLLGIDAKRVHVFHSMHRQDDGRLLATNEQMLTNIDTTNPDRGPKTAAFAPRVASRLEYLFELHKDLQRPANAGRRISLPPPITQTLPTHD
jgi:acyl-CoA thioester hydrolase